MSKAEREMRALFAQTCLYYPQYTLDDVAEMAIGDVELLLNTARIRELERHRAILTATAAAQSKKGYNKLAKDLKKGIKGYEDKL